MKNFKQILIALMMLTIPVLVNASDKTFIKQMEKEISGMEKISGMDSWLNQAGVFEKISKENSGEWLIFYYESYAYLKAGMEAKENIQADRYYDQSLLILEKAVTLSPANSEISTLKSWIISMKISIDPMARGYELGMQANQLLSAAIIQDATNPRPYLLQGLAAMYTPEEYGGSKKVAADLLNQSIQKFAEFKSASSIMPSWGLDKAKQTLKEVQ
ncbi:MAG: hypothetical protein IPP71_04980 [Bacteroidetes bacterium]|nr:hypothetical protein [Bacteroidota bacterium]